MRSSSRGAAQDPTVTLPPRRIARPASARDVSPVRCPEGQPARPHPPRAQRCPCLCAPVRIGRARLRSAFPAGNGGRDQRGVRADPAFSAAWTVRAADREPLGNAFGRAARPGRIGQRARRKRMSRSLPVACPSKRPLGRPCGPDRLRWVRNAQRADCAGGSSFRESARGPTERTLRPAACRLPCPRAHPRSADSPPKERCFGLLNGFPATRNDERYVPLREPGRSVVAGTAPRTRWPKRRRNSIRSPSWMSAFRATAHAPLYWRPAPVPLAPRNLGPVCGTALPAGTRRTPQVGSGLAAAPSAIRA